MDKVFTGYEKTKKGRFSLFFDDEFLFSVCAETFASVTLKRGESYTIEEVENLRERDEELSCRQRAIAILSAASQTEHRLREKLLRYFSKDAIDSAVNRMLELGLLDDKDYARRYTADAVGLKGLPKRRILQELRRRGISGELVSQTVDTAFCDYDETELAVKLIAKKYSHKLDDKNDRQKVIAALARKGFGYSTIREAIQRFSEQYDMEYDDFS